MIYVTFGALLIVIVGEGFVIFRLLSKMSELENKLMSRDFTHYMTVRNVIEKKKPVPTPKVVPSDEVRFDAISGRELND